MVFFSVFKESRRVEAVVQQQSIEGAKIVFLNIFKFQYRSRISSIKYRSRELFFNFFFFEIVRTIHVQYWIMKILSKETSE